MYQDKGTSDDLTVQKNFLANEAGKFSNSIGDAYVGYNDYYAAGGDPSAAAGFVIPESDSNGETLTETLDQDQTYSKNIAAIQIATWNDYGEGTMIEPTVQNGFSSLQQIQKFTGVSYGLSQLQLVYQLYEAREKFLGNSTEEAVLSQSSNDINNLDFPDAQKSLADAVSSTPETIGLINSLTLNGTAGFNLTNDKLIISYTPGSDPIATIRAICSRATTAARGTAQALIPRSRRLILRMLWATPTQPIRGIPPDCAPTRSKSCSPCWVTPIWMEPSTPKTSRRFRKTWA